MVQVVETMAEIGVEPIMTSATERFFSRSLSLGFKDACSKKPESFEEVVGYLERKLGDAGCEIGKSLNHQNDGLLD